MTRPAIVVVLLGCLGLFACGDGGQSEEAGATPETAQTTVDGSVDDADRPPPAPAPASGLTVDSTWHWQLQGDINTSYDVDVYDIDLFDTDASTIAELRSEGRSVVCYFSAGSVEEFRSDAADFEPSTVGETLDGWEDERWVDVRDPSVRAVMTTRLDLAVEKGCDGVEPDNVTAHQNDTGFSITADDQLGFNRFLAAESHRRGLLIGLKNDLGQIPELVDDFDFAVNEECFEYDECDVYQPFLDAGKPVFSAEYAAEFVASPEPLCDRARRVGLRTLVLPLDLDDEFRVSCDS